MWPMIKSKDYVTSSGCDSNCMWKVKTVYFSPNQGFDFLTKLTDVIF